MRAKRVCVPKMGLSFLALYSKFHFSPEEHFFQFYSGWVQREASPAPLVIGVSWEWGGSPGAALPSLAKQSVLWGRSLETKGTGWASPPCLTTEARLSPARGGGARPLQSNGTGGGGPNEKGMHPLFG